MNLFYALLLGIIEGLTEFIPVSSTAHMLIVQKLLNIPSTDIVTAFLILVQIGPLVALVIYFWNDLWMLVKAFFVKPFSTSENKLVWFVIIATIPALAAGALLEKRVEALFQTPLLEAGIRLLTASALLFLAEWLGKRTRNLDSMTWFDALVVGLFQIIAVFPGASRSGSTISGGMLRGFDRPSATRFAFLLAIPVMAAAAAYKSLSVFKLHIWRELLPPLAVGFVIAAIVGWLAIKWLLNYLNKNSLYVFAAYCAVIGVVVLLLK